MRRPISVAILAQVLRGLGQNARSHFGLTSPVLVHRSQVAMAAEEVDEEKEEKEKEPKKFFEQFGSLDARCA